MPRARSFLLSTALLHHLIRRLDLRAPRLASSDAAQVSAAGSTGSYTCRPTAARWRMPVHEVAKSMLPVDAAGPPRVRQRHERRRRVTVHSAPDWTTACANRRALTGGDMGLTAGDMGGAFCDVGGTGSPSAGGRAVRRSWFLANVNMQRPGPRGPRIRGTEWMSPVPHPPMPTDDTASRRRAEPLRRNSRARRSLT